MKNNTSNFRIWLIFSAISLLTLMCLNQQFVYGQIPPRTTAPVTPTRQPTPTPRPMRAPVTPKRLPEPKAVDIRPDLIIKEIRLNKGWNPGSTWPRGVRLLIVNVGNGNAPKTTVFVAFNIERFKIEKNVMTKIEVASSFQVYVAPLKPGEQTWSESTAGALTPVKNEAFPPILKTVHAKVDPETVKHVETGETVYVSMCLFCKPVGWPAYETVKVPDKVKESNEKNNEMTV